MSTGSAAPPTPPPANTGWLWVVRIATWIILLLAILLSTKVSIPVWREGGIAFAARIQVLLTLTLVPYVLILVWLRGNALRKGLGLAAVTGWGGLIGAVLGAITISGDQEVAGILFVSQVLQLVGAHRAHAALRRQTSDQKKLTEGASRWSYFAGPLAFLGFFSLTILPNTVLTRVGANQASAVGALRTINTAEITYAETYKTGFSPSLAALAPPAAVAQPLASAAGFIDSVVASGVKNGYRFSYTPGSRDKAGHIQTHTLTARPLQYGKSGGNSYFADQSGVIRTTGEDCPATAKDEAIGR